MVNKTLILSRLVWIFWKKSNSQLEKKSGLGFRAFTLESHQHESGTSLQQAGLLLGLLLNTWDWGAGYPKTSLELTLYNNHCENLKSYTLFQVLMWYASFLV
jgi:hypothetical protein